MGLNFHTASFSAVLRIRIKSIRIWIALLLQCVSGSDFSLAWSRSGSDFTLWCGSGSGSCSSSKWGKYATTGLQTLHGTTLSLYGYASIGSTYGLLFFHLDPPQVLNFDFDADRDPTFYFDANPDPHPDIPKMMRMHANPDPQNWFFPVFIATWLVEWYYLNDCSLCYTGHISWGKSKAVLEV